MVLSDYQQRVVDYFQLNAGVNALAAKRCSYLRLDWTQLGGLEACHARRYDLLLAADVLYETAVMPAFVETLLALLHPEHGKRVSFRSFLFLSWAPSTPQPQLHAMI